MPAVGIDRGHIILTYHSPSWSSSRPGNGTNQVVLCASIIIYRAWLNQPGIRSADYITSGSGGEGGRAEQSRGRDYNRFWKEQSIWLVHCWTLRCVVMRTFTLLGRDTYISVRWLDLVCTLIWHKGHIDGKRRVPVGEKSPTGERERRG